MQFNIVNIDVCCIHLLAIKPISTLICNFCVFESNQNLENDYAKIFDKTYQPKIYVA